MIQPLLEEKNIVYKLVEGNEQAFEKIYKIYSPALFGKLINLVKSESVAKEILQDVFLKLWVNRKSIDPERSFRSYLFKIAENNVYDFFRKAARDKKLEAQLAIISGGNYSFIEDLKSGNENLARLAKAVDSLPPQRQQIFRLCKLEGKSYKEVAEFLGISVSTISDHIVKGTKSIREYFSHHVSTIFLFFAFLSVCGME